MKLSFFIDLRIEAQMIFLSFFVSILGGQFRSHILSRKSKTSYPRRDVCYDRGAGDFFQLFLEYFRYTQTIRDSANT
jgi:hypothetical protein